MIIMALYGFEIPIIPNMAQTLTTTIPLEDENKRIELKLSYNRIAGYWWADIFDPTTGEAMNCGLPLLYSEWPAENILDQYQYENIGACAVVPTSYDHQSSQPSFDDMGDKWALLWGTCEE